MSVTISTTIDVDLYKKIWQSDLLISQVSEIEDLFQENKLLDEALTLKGTVMAIIDVRTFMYPCVYGDVIQVCGWSKQYLLEEGVGFVLKHIPPADSRCLEKMQKLMSEYVKNLSEAESKLARAIFDYQLVRSDGSHGRMIQDTLCLKRDEQGNMLYMLAMLSNATHMKRDGRQHLRLSNGREDLIYEVNNTTSEIRQLETLSSREIEIAKLIGRKMTSEEIAEKLFLSPHTVNTHRQNMLRKLDMMDTLELISFLSLYRFI
ncbi:helix-turn-helix transcriptional regulator [Telluribacter sp. SYSU D00476]|uniref:helix-turn-helix transcriptional regulator n=1 Tax=Telluribacter sp. SYSU D00476 TaxID=2811430 RepID=UPI001FF1AEE5|nr:helix-turn-helix transcriptional regulator [Telluribacter sp. SYSU D00476]